MSEVRSERWYIEEIASDDADDAQDGQCSVVEGEALVSSPGSGAGTSCNTKEDSCAETLRNSSTTSGTNENEVKRCLLLRMTKTQWQSQLAFHHTYNLRVVCPW